jgi:hypothetical protein
LLAGHARARGRRAGTEVRIPDLCSGSELKAAWKSKRSSARAFENNSGYIDMALFPVVHALGLFALTVPVRRAGMINRIAWLAGRLKSK